MITEDYVSFETAKLLKKKGFNEKCRCLYNKGEFDSDGRLLDWNTGEIYVSAPTLQTAMKWLRQVHKLEIYPFHHKGHPKDKWGYNIKKEMPLSIIDKTQTLAIFDSYEESCDVAIQYCLVHLI